MIGLETIEFHDTTPATLPLLLEGLRALSVDLDDPFHLTGDVLHKALFGPAPSCHGLLALGPDRALAGLALYSPVLSSVMGCAGVYVSDLWVAEAARGRRLGPRLLTQVGGRSGAMWGAGFMKLVSYTANSRARAFYARMGFAEKPDELPLLIRLDALEQNED